MRPCQQGRDSDLLSSLRLPLLAAKQRPTHRNDWMTSDAEIACPDPNCGSRLRISRLGLRRFSHAQTTAGTLAGGTRMRSAPRRGKWPASRIFDPNPLSKCHSKVRSLQTETRLDRIFDPNSFHRAAFTSGEPPRPTLFLRFVDKSNDLLAKPPRPDRTCLRARHQPGRHRPVAGRGHGAGGAPLDRRRGARRMADTPAAGFDTFDMADHYGSAEMIAGRFLARVRRAGIAGARPAAFTKWCPKPGPMTPDSCGGRGAQPATARRRTHRPPAVPLVDLRASRPGSTRCTSWRS